jgi:hypothetical protein
MSILVTPQGVFKLYQFDTEKEFGFDHTHNKTPFRAIQEVQYITVIDQMAGREGRCAKCFLAS